MGKKRTRADYENQLTFRVLYNHYRTMALNTFEWSGLPEGIEERYVERALFDEGKCLFFRDPSMSYMALPCFQGSQLDVYSEPLTWRAMGLNYNKEYRRDRCVLIENNKMRTPTHETVLMFVRKLYEAERTMDVNLRTSKTPWFIITDERKVLTYKDVLRRIDENEPAIFGAPGLNPDAFQVIPAKSEFLGNELMDYAHSVENKLLTFLRVDNCKKKKKERLVTDEVSSNDNLLQINADLMLEARKRACESINTMFGLSVSVKLRHEPKEVKEDVAGGEQQSDRGAAGAD